MTSPALRQYVLAFADDEHLMGQQHTEWIGVAPFLEEDLAFSSIGQDELGHAAMLYEYLATASGANPDADAMDEAIDALAYGRAAADYRSCHLVERVTSEWAEALVRHWLYDTAETLRWQQLNGSADPVLSAIATRALTEESFHLRHANALLDELMRTQGAADRVTDAALGLVPIAAAMFDGTQGEDQVVGDGIASGFFSERFDEWKASVQQRFPQLAPAAWSEPLPDQHARSLRSGDFAPLMARMREVLDFDPGAKW